MANITISLNDQLLKESRQYAQKQQTSLNNFIRHLLTKTISADQVAWLQETFTLMDKARGHSHNQTWSREELHR